MNERRCTYLVIHFVYLYGGSARDTLRKFQNLAFSISANDLLELHPDYSPFAQGIFAHKDPSLRNATQLNVHSNVQLDLSNAKSRRKQWWRECFRWVLPGVLFCYLQRIAPVILSRCLKLEYCYHTMCIHWFSYDYIEYHTFHHTLHPGTHIWEQRGSTEDGDSPNGPHSSAHCFRIPHKSLSGKSHAATL